MKRAEALTHDTTRMDLTIHGSSLSTVPHYNSQAQTADEQLPGTADSGGG